MGSRELLDLHGYHHSLSSLTASSLCRRNVPFLLFALKSPNGPIKRSHLRPYVQRKPACGAPPAYIFG